MIKVIPCPKTYEISEEKIPCLPLRIFTEEEDCLPVMFWRRLSGSCTARLIRDR